MKIFITKYALTKGIFEAEAEPSEYAPTMMCVKKENLYSQFFHGEGRDWHRTRESAVQRAEDLRDAKILTLQKKINRLKKLTF